MFSATAFSSSRSFRDLEQAVAQASAALEEFRLALSLDPLSPIMNTNYATTLMDAHRYPEALAQFQKTLERDPIFHQLQNRPDYQST